MECWSMRSPIQLEMESFVQLVMKRLNLAVIEEAVCAKHSLIGRLLYPQLQELGKILQYHKEAAQLLECCCILRLHVVSMNCPPR